MIWSAEMSRLRGSMRMASSCFLQSSYPFGVKKLRLHNISTNISHEQDLRNVVRQAHHERVMISVFHPPLALSLSKGELFCVSPDEFI